ncbi:MAG: phage tail assembly protein [Gammaproteobacteria bacterium]|nr:phage tail assembly protein [Gammaproteobacteria bacterium]
MAGERTVTIPLDWPVTVDGHDYSELTMRRPVYKERREWIKSAKHEVDVEADIFVALCEVPPKVIDKLDDDDVSKLQEAYAGFFVKPSSEDGPSE